MRRRTLHLAVLASFWVATSGLALAAHHHTEGQHHQAQTCSVCRDLLSSPHAIVTSAPAVFPVSAPIEFFWTTAGHEPAVTAFPPAVSPRAPPRHA